MALFRSLDGVWRQNSPARRFIFFVIGIAAIAALYSTSRGGQSSGTPPIQVVDADEIATRVAATASVPNRPPDGQTGNMFTVSGRRSLGVCVQDLTGTVSDPAEILALVTDSLADLQANPLWPHTSVAGDPPVVAASCPLASPILTSRTRDSRGKLYAMIPPSSVATPFAVFVFVVSEQIIERDFAREDPMFRVRPQETLCRQIGGPCIVVSYGTYVTPEEFRDRSLRSSLFSRTIGFQRPPAGPPSTDIVWASGSPSAETSPTVVPMTSPTLTIVASPTVEPSASPEIRSNSIR